MEFKLQRQMLCWYGITAPNCCGRPSKHARVAAQPRCRLAIYSCQTPRRRQPTPVQTTTTTTTHQQRHKSLRPTSSAMPSQNSSSSSSSSDKGYSVTSSGTNSQVSRCRANVIERTPSYVVVVRNESISVSDHGRGLANKRPQGNHYCSRDYGSSASNQNSYHYSNSDGSYYYSNSNDESPQHDCTTDTLDCMPKCFANTHQDPPTTTMVTVAAPTLRRARNE